MGCGCGGKGKSGKGGGASRKKNTPRINPNAINPPTPLGLAQPNPNISEDERNRIKKLQQQAINKSLGI